MATNSSRITLRPFKLSDVDDLMLVVGDDRVSYYTRWNTFDSREQALTFIRDVCIPHPCSRSICIDDRCITPGSGDERCRGQIGYAIATKYWGQGICSKAAKIAVSQGFKDFPDLVRIQAYVDAENSKVGFLKEAILRKYACVKGKIRDVAIFSLVSDSVDTHPPE